MASKSPIEEKVKITNEIVVAFKSLRGKRIEWKKTDESECAHVNKRRENIIEGLK